MGWKNTIDALNFAFQNSGRLKRKREKHRPRFMVDMVDLGFLEQFEAADSAERRRT